MPENLQRLDTGEWVKYERIVQQFEEAWKAGTAPTLEKFIPPDAEWDQELLLELAHTDLELRLDAGEPARVESYLGRFPKLTADAAMALDLITAEFAIRSRRDPSVTSAEYCRRFPQWADELTVRLDPTRGSLRPAWPTIPGHEIIEELGRGGMGIVYRARQIGLKRHVAVKMIRGGTDASEEDVARFRTEAEAAARLQHPNIVQIFEVGECGHPPLPYFSMEYVEGVALSEALAGAPLSAREAAELAATLARAVHHAHERGIVHRDLKPANVLLSSVAGDREQRKGNGPRTTDYGQPKINDFGLARRLDADLGQTQTGAILGTPSYMAPEQADGRTREIGPSVDVYALGAILYEMLTGRPPFRGATVLDTLELVRSQEPVPPRRLQPHVPRDLETACLHCLQKDAARRYASARALAEDLERFLRDEPICARPVSVREHAWRWCRRNPLVAGVSGLAAVLVIVAFGIVWSQWRRAQAAAVQTAHERDRTWEALEAMTSDVAENWLATQSELRPEQKQFLRNAVKYYREFSQHNAADEAGRQRVAAASHRLGTLLDRLGEQAEAEAAFRDAATMRDQLVQDFPDEPSHRFASAETYQHLAIVLHNQRQMKEAEELTLKAIAHFRELHEKHPQESSYQAELAASNGEFGNLLRDLGRLDEAERAHRESIQLGEALVVQFPAEPKFRRNLSKSLTNLGVVLLDLRRFDEAERSFRESLQRDESLVADFPRDTSYRDDLARAFNNLGVLLEQRGRLADAEPMFRRGLPHHRQLVDEFPSVPQYRRRLAWNLHNLGLALEDLEQWQEAEAMQKEAITVLEQLCRLYPDAVSHLVALCQSYRNYGNLLRKRGMLSASLDQATKSIEPLEAILAKDAVQPSVRESLYNAYFDRATVLDELGTYPDALRDWDRAIELSPEHFRDAARLARATTLIRSGDYATALSDAATLTAPSTAATATLYNGAEVYSLASAAMKDDPNLAEEYAQKSVALLRRAVEKGYTNWRKLRKERQFEPLQSRPDFKTLIAELESRPHTPR